MKKIIITIISILVIGVICSYLYLLGAFNGDSILGSIFILIGIIFLVIGQIMMLYKIWEDEDEKNINN